VDKLGNIVCSVSKIINNNNNKYYSIFILLISFLIIISQIINFPLNIKYIFDVIIILHLLIKYLDYISTASVKTKCSKFSKFHSTTIEVFRKLFFINNYFLLIN